MRREDSTVQFCTGFSFGLLLGTFLVLLLSAWLHGRAVERRAWVATPIRATPIVHRQDRPAIRAAEIERRKERFAEPVAKIDLNRIAEIESSGDPKATGAAGERGLCQIMPATWSDVTREMGVDWSFDEAWDPKKNLAVADWYLHVTLPRYLKHYDIPDTSSARLAAFNYGIGNINRLHGEHGGYWLKHTPECVQGYVRRYCRAEPQRNYVAVYGYTARQAK